MDEKVLYVEAVQKTSSGINKKILMTQIDHFVRNETVAIVYDQVFIGRKELAQNVFLSDHILSVSIESGNGYSASPVRLRDAQLRIFVYKLDSTGCQVEDIEGNEGIHAANNYLLPSEEFNGLWESLVYDGNIKDRMLRYINTCIKLSDVGIDPNIVSNSKVVLLHGPPGTGKTSLCKALAQKVSIRLGDRYSLGQLIEINSHSLFSKWFSESGKLVQKIPGISLDEALSGKARKDRLLKQLTAFNEFEQIHEMISDPRVFVCVLIDEVESLTAARKSNSQEPSDAIRVVNAVLTQIDSIRRHPNVLVLTTSNVTGTIDVAFVDRADIKYYIGLPSKLAICSMLHGSVMELMLKGVLCSSNIANVTELLHLLQRGGLPVNRNDEHLLQIAIQCEGLSGRAIRRLPFLALTRFDSYPVNVEDFFNALKATLDQEKEDINKL